MNTVTGQPYRTANEDQRVQLHMMQIDHCGGCRFSAKSMELACMLLLVLVGFALPVRSVDAATNHITQNELHQVLSVMGNNPSGRGLVIDATKLRGLDAAARTRFESVAAIVAQMTKETGSVDWHMNPDGSGFVALAISNVDNNRRHGRISRNFDMKPFADGDRTLTISFYGVGTKGSGNPDWRGDVLRVRVNADKRMRRDKNRMVQRNQIVGHGQEFKVQKRHYSRGERGYYLAARFQGYDNRAFFEANPRTYAILYLNERVDAPDGKKEDPRKQLHTWEYHANVTLYTPSDPSSYQSVIEQGEVKAHDKLEAHVLVTNKLNDKYHGQAELVTVLIMMLDHKD